MVKTQSLSASAWGGKDIYMSKLVWGLNGIPSTIVQTNGDILHLGPDRPRKLTEISSGRLVLDGDIIIPSDGEAITMRRRLARDGL